MYPKFLHIYGPIYINGYNLSLAIGIFLFLYLASSKAEKLKIMARDKFINIAVESAIFGIICARIMHVFSEFDKYKNFLDMISIWDGGLSVIGSILGIILYCFYILNKNNIEILPTLDIVASYVALTHAIGRIGCFLVGCCYGKPTNLPWAITYNNKDILAPLNIPLHPTQLYSALIYLFIFITLQIIFNKTKLKNGQILMLYLILSSIERIIVDYFRDDRIFVNNSYFSFYQLIAFMILIGAGIGLILINYYNKPSKIKSHESF